MSGIFTNALHGQAGFSQLTNLRHCSCYQGLVGGLPPRRKYLQPSFSCSFSGRLHVIPCAAAAQNGTSPAAAPKDKPEWLRIFEEDAKEDPDLAQLLEGANGDPNIVEERMRQSMKEKQKEIMSDQTGDQRPMQITLREIDPFNLWVWMELYDTPSEDDVGMVEEVLKAWFVVGRLGGFNGMNLQVSENVTDEGASNMKYDVDECESALDSLFHDMSNTESNGNWLRAWVNIGTADELAIDVLINMLFNFSRENLGIKHLIVGGENEDWKIPEMQLPKGTIRPMETNMPWDDDEFDMNDY